jgi:hypothetical protein
VLKNHPDGEFICDYLENDAYIPGHFIVPEKYTAKFKEAYRAGRYEYYLKRGLPIPKEYMPKDEGDSTGKRKLFNEMMTTQDNTRTSTPQFNMVVNPSAKGVGGARQDKRN